MTVESPTLFVIALALAGISAIAIILRAHDKSAFTKSALIGGLLFMALGAGGLTLKTTGRPAVAVMVDRSASTRTAAYRENPTLQIRIHQLIGNDVAKIIDFSSESAERTIFEPPGDVDAIFLFSDGRFEAPAMIPPVFAVIDPNLEHPKDASITRIEPSGNSSVTVAVNNEGDPRKLIAGDSGASVDVASGSRLLELPIASSTTRPIAVTLSPGDAWPENDSLGIRMANTQAVSRWWIGGAPSGLDAGWTAMRPSDLPSDTSAYINALVIVLDNVSANAFSADQQERLGQFVRDLGGGLVILGGDHSFAVGDYVGSSLEALSPLASSPENPQRDWVILLDSSGSMASPTAEGSTRWLRASAAALQLIKRLPPNDQVTIGSFARDLQVWAADTSPARLARMTLPPHEITPAGPTNLNSILTSIAGKLNAGARIELILISDADATIQKPDELAQSFRDVGTRVHLLVTGEGSRESLQKLSALTNGTYSAQPDAALWSAALTKLYLSTLADRLGSFPIQVEFEKELAKLTSRSVTVWNRTWAKENATILATGDDSGSRSPLAARWRVGLGQVAATAFAANGEESTAIANLILKSPRDPRFKISWKTGPILQIVVEAADAGRSLTNLSLSASIGDESNPARNTQNIQLVQSTPGHYQASIPAPRFAALVSVLESNRAIDRLSIPGRYPEEFDTIGNDRQALQSLAARTGGIVIEPTQVSPIEIQARNGRVNLLAPLTGIGLLLIAIGLLALKRKS